MVVGVGSSTPPALLAHHRTHHDPLYLRWLGGAGQGAGQQGSSNTLHCLAQHQSGPAQPRRGETHLDNTILTIDQEPGNLRRKVTIIQKVIFLENPSFHGV